MAELHNGVLNKLYGSLRTEEQFNKELQRVMEMGRMGYDIQYFRDKFGRIKVKRGSEWWVMADLAKLDPFYNIDRGHTKE